MRFAAVIIGGLAIASGCTLAGRNSPAPAALLSCRQLTQRGMSAGERGEWDRAEQLLAQAVKACPVDADARRQYAEALWHRGARAEALAQLDEAIRLSSDDPALLVRASEMKLELGKFEAAFSGAGQALDLDPKSCRAWAARGHVMRASGQLRPALADYQRALSYEPRNREVLLAIAEIYRQLDQPQRALVSLQSLIDTYPPGEEPQQPLMLAGMAYTALGRFDEASRTFQLASARGPITPDLLFRLADAELQAGRLENARAAADQALQLQPEHQPSRAMLERIAMSQPDVRRQ